MRSQSAPPTSPTWGVAVIGDDLAAGLPELRAQAESLMTATGQIGTVTEVFDRATNKTIKTFAEHYAGRMRVWHATKASVATVAGQSVTANPLLCSVPHDVTGITTDMVVRVTEVGPDGDPDLIGQDFPIRDISRHQQAVRRLLTLIDHQD